MKGNSRLMGIQDQEPLPTTASWKLQLPYTGISFSHHSAHLLFSHVVGLVSLLIHSEAALYLFLPPRPWLYHNLCNSSAVSVQRSFLEFPVPNSQNGVGLEQLLFTKQGPTKQKLMTAELTLVRCVPWSHQLEP